VANWKAKAIKTTKNEPNRILSAISVIADVKITNNKIKGNSKQIW